MRLSRPSLRGAPSTPWRSALVLSGAVLGACSLDSTGGDPPSSAASASSGSASSTGGGPGPGPSSVSSAGEGAGPTSSSGGGDGGATGGGSPATGGGGAGDGGSGGSGPGGGGTGAGGTGGAGGSGPVDEWLARVHGNNNQVVHDVAVGRGGFVYIVGTATYDDVKVDGDDITTYPITEEDDVFAAKLSADGTTVEWFVSFGGAGNDRGYSIAMGRDDADDEHLYIGGVGQNTFSDAETFVPDATPTTNEWGFVMELGTADGVALGGTVWGGVDLNLPVDVTTIDGVAFAVGTATYNCTDSEGATNKGQDLIVARYPFDEVDDAWSTRLISRDGDQRGVAIAADPTTRGFALLGEMRENVYDPGLGIQPSDCSVATRGNVDAFVASYAFASIDFECQTAIALGSPSDDQAHALAFDGTSAYAAVTLGEDDLGQIGGRATYVVAVKGTSFDFSAQLSTTANSNAFALVLDGEDVGVAGRVDDRGFIETMRADDGMLGPRRSFTDNFNQARGLAISGRSWFVGGIFESTVNFDLATDGAGGGGGAGGADPPVPITAENARDGWIARLNRPD